MVIKAKKTFKNNFFSKQKNTFYILGTVFATVANGSFNYYFSRIFQCLVDLPVILKMVSVPFLFNTVIIHFLFAFKSFDVQSSFYINSVKKMKLFPFVNQNTIHNTTDNVRKN